MGIDDPKAAFEQQYMQEEEKSPLALTVLTAKLAFPKVVLRPASTSSRAAVGWTE